MEKAPYSSPEKDDLSQQRDTRSSSSKKSKKKGKQQSISESDDKDKGASCHGCHTSKPESDLMFCTRYKAEDEGRSRSCDKKYCAGCLKRCSGVPRGRSAWFDPDQRQGWVCPACLGCCPCRQCQKNYGANEQFRALQTAYHQLQDKCARLETENELLKFRLKTVEAALASAANQQAAPPLNGHSNSYLSPHHHPHYHHHHSDTLTVSPPHSPSPLDPPAPLETRSHSEYRIRHHSHIHLDVGPYTHPHALPVSSSHQQHSLPSPRPTRSPKSAAAIDRIAVRGRRRTGGNNNPVPAFTRQRSSSQPHRKRTKDERDQEEGEEPNSNHQPIPTIQIYTGETQTYQSSPQHQLYQHPPPSPLQNSPALSASSSRSPTPSPRFSSSYTTNSPINQQQQQSAAYQQATFTGQQQQTSPYQHHQQYGAQQIPSFPPSSRQSSAQENPSSLNISIPSAIVPAFQSIPSLSSLGHEHNQVNQNNGASYLDPYEHHPHFDPADSIPTTNQQLELSPALSASYYQSDHSNNTADHMLSSTTGLSSYQQFGSLFPPHPSDADHHPDDVHYQHPHVANLTSPAFAPTVPLPDTFDTDSQSSVYMRLSTLSLPSIGVDEHLSAPLATNFFTPPEQSL